MAMDNAGNGRRGLRATPSAELFRVLRDRYGIEAEDASVDVGGSANLNLLAGGGRWVARVYRPYVTVERLGAIGSARASLSAAGVPVAATVATVDGAAWATLGDRLVEVERYVASDAQMDSWERLEAGMPLLGRIHALLARVRVGTAGRQPEFVNHVEAHEAFEWATRAARRIHAWGPSPAEMALAERTVELARLLWEAEREVVRTLPRQLVHGDFWDNNVLFRQGRVVLVTDFDFMGERARIDDLALTLYFANATFAGDLESDDRLRRLRGLVDAYDSGLDDPLTDAERAALPLALARQPLWAAGRWLALLDDEGTARRLAAEMPADVSWALQILGDLRRWQDAFI